MANSLNSISTAANAQDILIHEYLHLLSITILFYDHLISLGVEINFIWRRSKTQGDFWFFLNRYVAFLGTIVITALNFLDISRQSCQTANIFRQLLLLFNQLLVCVLLTLRTLALYNGSIRVLAGMLISGSCLTAIGCWSLFGQESQISEPGSGCHIGHSQATAIRFAAAWEALFVYDVIIFSLTMNRTWQARDKFATGRNRVFLVSLLFRDGSIYFAVMALANMGNILTFYLCRPFLKGSLSTFASAISVTMMSRLTLNLHEAAHSSRHIDTRSYSETNPVWNVDSDRDTLPLQSYPYR